jgi:serine/threonine protein phosphatase PrpC
MNEVVNNHYIIVASTDRGSVREKNEDYFGVFEPETDEVIDELGILVVVSDGMGGHFSGAEASRTAVEVISDVYFDRAEGDPLARLKNAFDEANKDIFELVGHGLTGMAGTTCTAALLFPEFVHVAHAGDSRAYVIRKGEIEQLTVDHSVVGEMMRKGMLTKEEARNHPHRNVITRAMGLQLEVQVDLIESVDVWPGDVIMLCSDGLFSMISEEEMAKVISGMPPAEAAKKLIERAKEEGGTDNITIVIAVKKES